MCHTSLICSQWKIVDVMHSAIKVSPSFNIIHELDNNIDNYSYEHTTVHSAQCLSHITTIFPWDLDKIMNSYSYMCRL